MSSRLPNRHILLHLQDVLLDDLNVGLDLLERPGRDVAVQEQGLTVADARESGTEAARRAAFVFFGDRVLVPLPVLSVGGDWRSGSRRTGRQWRSLESVLPKATLSASRPVGSFMKKSDLETAHVSGFTSWPKRWMSACALIGGLSGSPFLRSPSVMCSLAIISMPPEPQQES